MAHSRKTISYLNLLRMLLKGVKHPARVICKNKETSKTYHHHILAFYRSEIF